MKPRADDDHPASVLGALAALRRAGRVAVETARRTNTAVVLMIDAKIAWWYPAEGAVEYAPRVGPAPAREPGGPA